MSQETRDLSERLSPSVLAQFVEFLDEEPLLPGEDRKVRQASPISADASVTCVSLSHPHGQRAQGVVSEQRKPSSKKKA